MLTILWCGHRVSNCSPALLSSTNSETHLSWQVLSLSSELFFFPKFFMLCCCCFWRGQDKQNKNPCIQCRKTNSNGLCCNYHPLWYWTFSFCFMSTKRLITLWPYVSEHRLDGKIYLNSKQKDHQTGEVMDLFAVRQAHSAHLQTCLPGAV